MITAYDTFEGGIGRTVALAMMVAADRFSGEHAKQREFVAERKEEVAAWIGRGEAVAGI